MFELHLTCSKDIDYLEINFADGTSVVSSPKEPKPGNQKPGNQKPSSQKSRPRDAIQDFSDASDFNQKTPALPEVPEVSDRDVKIDEILDNLEI